MPLPEQGMEMVGHNAIGRNRKAVERGFGVQFVDDPASEGFGGEQRASVKGA